MNNVYNVIVDESYIRDAQIIDTIGLSDEEFIALDFSSPMLDNLCHDIEPRHLIATVFANSEEEAVASVADKYRYDRRVLYAEKITF